MTTVQRATDTASLDREAILTLGLEMACASVSHYRGLPRAGRRELLTVWAEFAQNLAALGVPRPTAPTALED